MAALCAMVLGCGGDSVDGPVGIVIQNARIIDGTWSAPRSGSVRIVGDRSVAVGDVSKQRGDSVLDALGLVLAPGFIDTHSHTTGGRASRPDALAAVSQGITTVIGGQDGGSPRPLRNRMGMFASRPKRGSGRASSVRRVTALLRFW